MTPQQYLERCAQAWNATLDVSVNPVLSFVWMRLNVPFKKNENCTYYAMGVTCDNSIEVAIAQMWTIYQQLKYVDADLMPRSLEAILN